MSNKNPDYDRLFDLWISGTISPSEGEELFRGMEEDPEVMNRFRMNVLADFILVEYFELAKTGQCDPSLLSHNRNEDTSYAELNRYISDELIALQNSLPPIQRECDTIDSPLPWQQRVWMFMKNCVWPDPKTRNGTIAPVVTIIAVVLLSLLGILFWIEREGALSGSNSFPTMARVNETIDAVWSENTSSYKRGQLIDGQTPLSLQSGLVQLEMNNGTKLILEGPTELSLCSAMNSFCQSGKVSIRVPRNAIGYELTTPFGAIIDQGTEFFVEVGRNETHTEVMEGKVDFNRVNQPIVHIPQGKRLSYELNQKEKVTPLQKPRGISSNVFDVLVIRHHEKWIAAKMAYFQELDKSPNLLIRFNGNSRVKSVIPNAAQNGMAVCRELRLNNCFEGPGVVEGMKSIQFGRRQSSADFSLYDKYDSMTMCVSFQLTQYNKQGEILLASKNFLKDAGTCQWKILGTGEVCFFLTTIDKKQLSFRTKPVISPLDCGPWLHLAIVIDKEQKTITHYLDGRTVQTAQWDEPFPIALGDTTLGTMKNERLVLSDRCFNGSMEEIQIWNKALTADEIANLIKQ
ncbi:MAG: LamG-like jellyroll fold domain-containing protein [Planctomycetia bacterium]|nr:LamG-like jellyroll fold domain-containing protein [Planctomycetia bacterium]